MCPWSKYSLCEVMTHWSLWKTFLLPTSPALCWVALWCYSSLTIDHVLCVKITWFVSVCAGINVLSERISTPFSWESHFLLRTRPSNSHLPNLDSDGTVALRVDTIIFPPPKCGALLLYGFMSIISEERRQCMGQFSKIYFRNYAEMMYHMLFYVNVTYEHTLLLEHTCQSSGSLDIRFWNPEVCISWPLDMSCSPKRNKTASFCQGKFLHRDPAVSFSHPHSQKLEE